MADNELSAKDRKFIKGWSEFNPTNPEELSDIRINEINNTAVNKKLAKKHLMKSSKDISTTTYVIPVSDGGAVTGYYYSSPKISEETGLVPLMVFFHGGGWIFGNMDFYSIFLRHLAEVTESAILSIDYRLAPKYRFPVAIEDCYDAFLWAAEGAKYWKVDPDRIYLAGDSCGGNLAASVAILARDRKGPSVAGQILLYPILDGRLRTQSQMEFANTPTLNTKTLQFYIKSYTREPKDILSPMLSPLLSQDLTRLPPALLIAAELDPLVDDSKLYNEALLNADGQSRVIVSEGSFHGFMPFKHGKGREEAECAIKQFLSGRSLENIQFATQKELKAIAEHRA